MSVGPTVWYADSAQWSAVTAWAASTAVVAGAPRRQSATPAVGNERVFACVVAGTTGSSEPTWVVTKGAKTTDSGVTWMEVTGQPGVNGDLTNCPTWAGGAKGLAVALGFIVQDAGGDTLFICTAAGTAGTGAEPAWSKTAGATTTDATVTWTSLGAVGNFAKWAAPHARLASALAATWCAAGNTVFVGDDHAETSSVATTITGPGTSAAPCSILCVDHTAAVPPTAANLKTGATITQTGAAIFAVTGFLYIYGITLASSSTGAFNVGRTVCTLRFEAVTFALSSAAPAAIWFGVAGVFCEFIAVSFNLYAASQSINYYGGTLRWRDTPTPFSGAVPANVFNWAAVMSNITLDSVDLSAFAGAPFQSLVNFENINLQNCKVAPGVPLIAAFSPGQGVLDAFCTDGAGTNYQQARYTYTGTLTISTAIVRTGGASNGTTPIAQSIAASGTASWAFPFESQAIGIWNTLTGATRTVTIYGLFNGSVLPNNAQIWHDVRYLGAATSPLGSLGSGTRANALAPPTAWPADNSAWDSQATARANSHPYTAGQMMTVGGGQVWFCTVAGTSASAVPAGYTGAADGTLVADGGATFRAGMRFSMSVAVTPQMVGDLYSVIKVGQLYATFFIDPLLALS